MIDPKSPQSSFPLGATIKFPQRLRQKLSSRCRIALLLGSGLNAVEAQTWRLPPNVTLIGINNAYRVRNDWQFMLHALDFPTERLPPRVNHGQAVLSGGSYVPAMNAFGGIVHCGATMAMAGVYWALHQLQPHILAILGCDMDYQPRNGKTHFYGTGTPDPLREDPTLRDLRAKSIRAFLLALRQGTIVVNLSRSEFSRLAIPRAEVDEVFEMRRWNYWRLLHQLRRRGNPNAVRSALDLEARTGYRVPDGVYWTRTYDYQLIDTIDAAWVTAGRGFSPDVIGCSV